MKKKIRLAGLAALLLGFAALFMTGCPGPDEELTNLRAQLNTKIRTAENFLAGVEKSSHDGNDIYVGDKWITQENYDRLEAAVGKARVALNSPQEAMKTALTELESVYKEVSSLAEPGKDDTLLPVTYAEGGGTLKSLGWDAVDSNGKPKAGKTIYYIDYANGNDTWSGTDPRKPWKTFQRLNQDESASNRLQPGTHILLNADCIWNGTSVNKDNYQTLARSANAGRIYPKGSGTADNRNVIDLYRIEFTYPDGSKGTTAKKDGVNAISAVVYFSANQRPIINGNGTPNDDRNDPYGGSGVVEITGYDYWIIRNMEVTNSFEDFSDPAIRAVHWYRRWNWGGNNMSTPLGAFKALYGINARSYADDTPITGIVIEQCYAHDIQSFQSNNQDNSSDWTTNTYFGMAATRPGKAGGGISVAFTNSTVQNNIVRRTGYMGIRTYTSTSGPKPYGRQNKFIGNYVDTVYGDGLVVSSQRLDGALSPSNKDHWNLIESNIFKDTCAAPNHSNGNFAACWAINSQYTLFQYNEAYGTLYGYQDGEAWDIDIDAHQTIYQYNYSHDNAGGALLIMGTANGVYRYNVSANDGIGSRNMPNVLNGPADDFNQPLDQYARSYSDFRGGQTIFHYTYEGTTANNNVPLIYNNTFFVGDIPKMGVFGHNTASNVNKYVRFYNNIILKAGGTGTLHLSYGHNGSGFSGGSISNPQHFKNNLLWAYNTDPNVEYPDGIMNGNVPAKNNVAQTNGNKWANPKLRIQQSGGIALLRTQRDTVLSKAAFTDPKKVPTTDAQLNDPAKLAEFTGKARVRARASLFMPTDPQAVNFGMVIPASRDSAIDGGWHDGFITMDKNGDQNLDFFGNPISNPPWVGASNAPFDAAKYPDLVMQP